MKNMRLDKYLSLAGIASRTETSKAVRGGEVLVDGIPARKADMQVDPDTVQVTFKGQPVTYRQFTYILMHKPDGVVSATEDGREQTVLDLLPEELRRIRPALFPCGRLDKHTTGLMLLTNNGDLSHRLLSPARHVVPEADISCRAMYVCMLMAVVVEILQNVRKKLSAQPLLLIRSMGQQPFSRPSLLPVTITSSKVSRFAKS